jgi:uncharacterized membrane protein
MMFWKPFTPEQEAEIVEAIGFAEKRTSAELRVHADKYCKSDAGNKAANVFKQLKMNRTEDRNGVLIYISVLDRKFSIIGDAGINEKVPADFWQSTRDKMLVKFKNDELVAGIKQGIEEAAEQLAIHFPYKSNDKNELSNDISYG